MSFLLECGQLIVGCAGIRHMPGSNLRKALIVTLGAADVCLRAARGSSRRILAMVDQCAQYAAVHLAVAAAPIENGRGRKAVSFLRFPYAEKNKGLAVKLTPCKFW